jgi:thioredoxin 1
MESEATNKSRVVMVESGESWDFYISQATTQTCPVSSFSSSSNFTICVQRIQSVKKQD